MPLILTRSALRRALDLPRIEAAIAAAERRTSGEIRLSISHFFWGDVRRTAERAFDRLGMSQTREGNGVLLFVVPSRRRFAVIGGPGIHQKVGDAWWTELLARLGPRFARGEYSEGLVEAIEAIGLSLATHFPYDAATDRNELSDAVDFNDRA